MKKLSRVALVFLIFLNGYVSLSLELVVLRQLSFYVGSSAVITSIIMAIFLGFMSFGYFVGESERVQGSRIRNILNLSFLVIAFFSVSAASFPLITQYFSFMYSGGITSGVIQTFVFSMIFLSVGPFLFGFNTTLLARELRTFSKKSTGNIMAWDTIGSVFGSIATTLLMMPFMGVNNTVVLITLLSVVAALVLRRRWWVWIMAVIILAISVGINSNIYQKRHLGILVNNANSTISVSEYADSRVLYMNGLPMSVYHNNNSMADYINYLNLNFIDTMPADKKYKILVLGAGGFTLGLNDTRNDYTFVDIEHTLKDVSEQHFLRRKLSKNKKFIVADASQYLKNVNELYDFILLDVYSNSYQVPESLITIEFMQRLRARVAPNGIIALNMIVSPEFNDKYSRVFDNTFKAVFPYNTSRQVIGLTSPWNHAYGTSNVVYVFYNIENDGRVYTINKTPVIYDR